MYWYALLLAHVFMIYLISWIPLAFLLGHFRVIASRFWSHFRLYVFMMLHSWLCLIPFSLIAIGLGWSPHLLGLQLPTNALLVTFFTIISLFICGLLVLPAHLLAKHSSEVRAYLPQPARIPLPEKSKISFLFIPFTLTLAIVEELLYRGFMLAYLTHIFPDVSLFLALIIAALFFGLGHLQQRMVGVVVGVLLGLALGWLYTSTGSLIPGMIIHAIFNLRMLFLPRHTSFYDES